MNSFTIIENPEELEWQGEDYCTTLSKMMETAVTFPELTESLIGRNNLHSIAILDKAIKLSKAVALILRKDGGQATGFLITPNCLLTNWHVFETAEEATGAVARFNYLRNENGELLSVTDVNIVPDEFYHSNRRLDYAIVAVEGTPGNEWGTIPITDTPSVEVGQDVFIIQHPGGSPKMIAMSDNEIKHAGSQFIQYLTDTRPCASGSPVFDDKFNLVALHHLGGKLPEPNTNLIYYRNQGVRMSAIQADLSDLDL